MSNESSGLECIGDEEIINSVVKPKFEFKSSHAPSEDNNIANSTKSREFNDYNREISDDYGDQPTVIQPDNDQNIDPLQSPNKGVPVVIHQKYGASTY